MTRSNASRIRRGGFTLIELILVMFILVAMASIVAPRLSGFFQGRGLSDEGKRFIALTQYARNHAIASGLPVTLWVNEEGYYGMREAEGYAFNTNAARYYDLGKDLSFELEVNPAAAETYNSEPGIFFLPDGVIDEGSISNLFIQFKDAQRMWISRSTNGLSYEIVGTEQLN